MHISLLNPCLWNFTYLLELLDEGIVDLAAYRGEDTLLSEGCIQDLLDGDGARNAD